MQIHSARKKAECFTFNGLSGKRASRGRLALLGVALSAAILAVGCVGATANPAGTTTGGTGGGSQSSQLSPSSSQVSFGNVTVGSSTSQLVTLTATGNANVTISSVTASGSGFSASGGSNVTLTPNQSVTVSVAFQPTATGSATGNLVIASNASNSSVQIGLSGDGVAASGTHSVSLNWQPSTSTVIGYFVFRGSSTNNLAQLNVTPVASTSYTDKSVTNGQTYVYAVKSVDGSNVMSGFSNPVTVTIPAQ